MGHAVLQQTAIAPFAVETTPTDTSVAVRPAPTQARVVGPGWLWGDIGNVVTWSQFDGMILVLLVTSRV